MSDPISSVSELLRFVKPKPTWDTAVVVNDDSSVAFMLASHVQQVSLICGDKSHVQAAKATAHRTQTSNLSIDSFNRDGFPFRNCYFDLLLCFHCSQTVSNLGLWIVQASQILKPQGLLVVTSYLVPGTRLHGKKARKLREAGNYINAWYRLRDLQFKGFKSQDQWEDILEESGFAIESQEIIDEVFDFDSWAEAANVNYSDRIRLKAMLIQAPEKALEFLTPQFSGDRINFRLPEITILATPQANRD